MSASRVVSAQCRGHFTLFSVSSMPRLVMARTIPYGGIGIIRSWKQNGYSSVPVYQFLDIGGDMKQVCEFDDKMTVFVYGEMETEWGKYVNVKYVDDDRLSDYGYAGWVSVWDVCHPGDWREREATR